MTKVMAFGSFDLFHKGHEDYLMQAKQFGDFLIVVLARDSSYEKLRNKNPMFSENARLGVVASKDYVNKAILGEKVDFYKVVEDEQPDVLVLGYDQIVDEEIIRDILAKRGINSKIVRAKAFMPEKYKSSKMKDRLGV